jgi:hypothetical protein
MDGETARIAIDHDVLVRSARELHRTAESLATVSATAASAQLSSNAFGLMNAWMTPPVNAVSSRSRELLRVSATVVEVVAAATDAAANDFASTEGDVLQWVEELDAQLTAGLAPLPPAASPAAPQPVPSPSPNPAPTAPVSP